MNVHINGREINRANQPTYIIFEAGPTHYGLESAKQLVDMAKEANADAIKFQYLYASRLMADHSLEITYKYLERDANGNEEFKDITERAHTVLSRRELSREEWLELKAHCDAVGLPMISTVTFEDEVDFLIDEMQVSSLKLASADINFYSFIRYCAKRCAENDVNFQMDTGNADISEIEKAVLICEEEGLKNITIHLCPTGYPAHLESINLNMLRTLKQLFPNYAIAFSDHTPGGEMDVAAIALGADMVEKTITLDRTIKSTEHSFSLEKKEAKEFIDMLRRVEIALGESRRVIPADVKKKRIAGRRSPYAKRDLVAGEKVTIADFEFRRPEVGLNSYDFERILNKELIKDIKQGEVLNYEHI